MATSLLTLLDDVATILDDVSVMTKVAAKVGLSDRGLAKLCARHDIPVPGRGYWARKQFGHVDPQQVHVHGLAAHGMALEVLDEHGHARAAVDGHLEDRARVRQRVAQDAGVDGEVLRLAALAVDHAGDEALAAESAGRAGALGRAGGKGEAGYFFFFLAASKAA